jgi:hypothetical protein
VVYGIINPDDSIYSIRLSKTFVGPGNALYYSKLTDSIYYRDAHVYLEVQTLDGQLLERIEMTETEIERRDPGIFSREPNYVFQTDSSQVHLKPAWYASQGIPYDLNLKIIAEIPGTEEPDTSVTRLRSKPRITSLRRSAFYKFILWIVKRLLYARTKIIPKAISRSWWSSVIRMSLRMKNMT